MKRLVSILILVLVSGGTAPPPAKPDDAIRVAAIYAKSGEAAEDNLELFQAVRFAVEEVNAKGGFEGRKVLLMEYDNHSTPIQSLLAAKQAVKDGTLAVIGASWSSHSLAMAPYLQKMKVPMICPDSTHPDITRAGDYIFRACFTDTFQGKALARFARKQFQAATAVTIRNITSDYSIGLSKTFERQFSDMGGKVLAVYDYKSQQTDFRKLLKKAKTQAPDVLFVPGHAESGFVVKQAQDLGLQAKMLGGDGWPYRQFYANGGQDLKEGYHTAHWNKAQKNEKTRDFILRYKNIYDVTDFAAISYDAAMLLFDAMGRAESITPKAIRDALAVTKNFQGVTGTISLDANGDPVKQVVVMKITNGRPKLFMTIAP